MNDRTAREEAVKNAVAITEQEGGAPSAYYREQLDRFIAGEISVREMVTAWSLTQAGNQKPDVEAAKT
jgi:hypothetical protein